MPQMFKSVVVAIALMSAVAASGQAGAQELAVGTIGASSDSPFFIADKRGYFKDEGLTVKFIRFDSAAKAMAPLGTGELAVASGATSAALYNAVKRGVPLKIVADKASNPPGFGFEALMVRKGLEECRRQGHKIVVVVGHSHFYPRFGFSSKLASALASPFGGGDSWMALELVPGALDGVAGRVQYPPPFGALV